MMPRLRHWLHRRRRPLRYALLDRLLRQQPATREQALRKRDDDLRGIVRFAVANTDYYRERFARAGIDAAGDWSIGDLPILHKEDVRRHLDALLSRDADRSAVGIGHTGGSTGKPLAFWYDEFKHELMRAGMCRSYMGSGWRPGQKIMNFWGARQDTMAGGVFSAGWEDFIAAEKTVSAYEYTAAQLDAWADAVRDYRPVLLHGYTSVLAELARRILAKGIAMPRTLLGVYPTAEVLDDGQRESMERAFGCKVFNQYGSREIPNIACECRRGNMHVFSDMVCLESLHDADEDRLIVTSLTNRLMPFIRYDIGDSGRLLDGECSCGWPFPLMAMGMCRHNDLIRTRAGRTFHPSYFNRLLYGLTQIEQYQFVQEAPDRIVLDVVAPLPLDAAVEQRLRDHIRRDVDPLMDFRLNRVAEIPRTASGKHRFVVSRCATEGEARQIDVEALPSE
jgi:phenylacetate-CoA ligase